MLAVRNKVLTATLTHDDDLLELGSSIGNLDRVRPAVHVFAIAHCSGGENDCWRVRPCWLISATQEHDQNDGVDMVEDRGVSFLDQQPGRDKVFLVE